MSTIRAKNRSKTQQGMSHAERQRRYRQAHGRGTVDLSRDTWAVLRRLGALSDRSNNQIVFEALIAVEQQSSEQPEAAERIPDPPAPDLAPCVNQERDPDGDGMSNAAIASTEINAAPDHDRLVEPRRAIASDADAPAPTRSPSSDRRSKRVRSTKAARRDAGTRVDHKPKATHATELSAETSLLSPPMRAGRQPGNKVPPNQTEMEL